MKKVFKLLGVILLVSMLSSCDSEDSACYNMATLTPVNSLNKDVSASATAMCSLTNDWVQRDDPDASLPLDQFTLTDLGFYYDDTVTDGKPYGNRWRLSASYPETANINVDFVFQVFGGMVGLPSGSQIHGNMLANHEIEFTTIMTELPYGKPRTTVSMINYLDSQAPIYTNTGNSLLLDVPHQTTGDIMITDINTCVVSYRSVDATNPTPLNREVACGECGTTVDVDGVLYLVECN
jgi:hypothetical protein